MDKVSAQGIHQSARDEVLLVFEKVGQVCVTCMALVFSNFYIHRWSARSCWLILAVILMILYKCQWIRYFKSTKTLKDFYSSFYGIPVVGATLPVVAFFFLGVYGKVIWLMVSVIILEIGHIGIHLQHLREIQPWLRLIAEITDIIRNSDILLNGV